LRQTIHDIICQRDIQSPEESPAFSRSEEMTRHNDSAGLPAIVSLFCGAGGLDLGFRKEKFEIPIAIDLSEAAIRTHKKNALASDAVCADIVELGPQGILDVVLGRIPKGFRIGVIGGPPCQGFSRANAGSSPDDPRNGLPRLYVDVVKLLKSRFNVEFIVFENVLGIRDTKHASTYASLVDGLESLGFAVYEHELCALDFGVPQVRKRIILAAMRQGNGYTEVNPRRRKGPATVGEAISGLAPPMFFSRGLTPKNIPVHPNHWTMRPRSERFRSPADSWRETRSFKLLEWNRPSPTIAFGHREIHVHPDGNRRLSIFEAMLLQGFPQGFVLEGNLSEQVEQVSNAVPPPLARSVAAAVKRSLRGK
jgi:DNA (cytosine-5)-methyltransferase 1